MKIKVSVVARELGLKAKEVVDIAKEIGIEAKVRGEITPMEAAKIQEYFLNGTKKTKKPQEKKEEVKKEKEEKRKKKQRLEKQIKQEIEKEKKTILINYKILLLSIKEGDSESISSYKDKIKDDIRRLKLKEKIK